MNFCAIDWNELIKILTPFVIAFFVYRIWHNQKSKEVVASEAKETIKDILLLVVSLNTLMYSPPKNIEKLNSILENHLTLHYKVFGNLLYLNECISEKQFERALNTLFDIDDDVESTSLFSTNSLNISRFNRDIQQNLNNLEKFLKQCELIINLLQPYSIYRKKI